MGGDEVSMREKASHGRESTMLEIWAAVCANLEQYTGEDVSVKLMFCD